MLHKFEKYSAHFQELKFVVKATDKKEETLLFKSMIYSTGEPVAGGSQKIVGTQGHRLHMYEPPEGESALPEGYYKAVKDTKTVLHLVKSDYDDQYPDFNRIIPSNDGLVGFTGKSLWDKYAEVIRVMSGCALNGTYFEDAVANDHICMYKATDGLNPVLFRGGPLTAVMMPIRP